MRKRDILLLIIILFASGCGNSNKTVTTITDTVIVAATADSGKLENQDTFKMQNTNASVQNSNSENIVGTEPAGNTFGRVSHQYKANGCATVVIVKGDGTPDLTLIPKDSLSSVFNIDGLEIYFNYRKLKIKNPAGCSVGIPAVLTDISKK